MRQNKTIQPPHPLIRAVQHLLISNPLEQNTRLWSALATALLEGTWKTVFVFPVQQVVFVLLVQWTPSYISSRDWALYHLPASKIPFAGREKSAANLVLLWILVRCRNSSQVSFKVRCAGPLPLLLDEVDFVNVRLDSRNLDCQPLNPWTSKAAGIALGPAFYRRSRLADLLNHPQEFLAEIEQYSLTRSLAWFPTRDAHAAP